MTMKNPPHPGLSVRHDCIEDLDLTITEAAEILGVTRQTLNNLVNGKSGISPEMAIRLDKAFGGGAETWRRGAKSPVSRALEYHGLAGRQHEWVRGGLTKIFVHSGTCSRTAWEAVIVKHHKSTISKAREYKSTAIQY